MATPIAIKPRSSLYSIVVVRWSSLPFLAREGQVKNAPQKNITHQNVARLNCLFSQLNLSLRKHPFLLALRRWGRFARRNVGDSGTEIPFWWRKSMFTYKSGSHGVPNINLSNFTCLLVDFGKVLCSSPNELQQNSNASSREEYIPQILTVLLEILHDYIWPLWPFVFCLSFVNSS